MTIDLSRTGAVSDDRAAEQIAEVAAVYAGKSETPLTEQHQYYLTGHPVVDATQYKRLEKEIARLRDCLTKLHTDGQRYMKSENLLNPDRARWAVACRRISEALSPTPTERADK